MTQKSLWCGVLIVALSVVLAAPANAQVSGAGIGYNGPIVGPIVGVIAALAVVTFLVIHYSKKRAITGCVNSEGSGMSVTDEKDKRIYALSGNTVGIKPGDRMRLAGKKAKSKGAGKALTWQARKVTKDFGTCQP